MKIWVQNDNGVRRAIRLSGDTWTAEGENMNLLHSNGEDYFFDKEGYFIGTNKIVGLEDDRF